MIPLLCLSSDWQRWAAKLSRVCWSAVSLRPTLFLWLRNFGLENPIKQLGHLAQPARQCSGDLGLILATSLADVGRHQRCLRFIYFHGLCFLVMFIAQRNDVRSSVTRTFFMDMATDGRVVQTCHSANARNRLAAEPLPMIKPTTTGTAFFTRPPDVLYFHRPILSNTNLSKELA